MRVESPVSFERVCETFVRENPDPRFGSTDYALRLLEAANIQFGEWYSVALSLGVCPSIQPWTADLD